MAKIPTFHQHQLKQLAAALAESLQLYGDRGMLVRKVDDGWQVSAAAEPDELLPSRRTVALVSKPDPVPLAEQPPPPEDSLVLKPFALIAREVQYKSVPPVAPDSQQDAVVDYLSREHVFPGYEFASEEFRVYPAIGWTVDDYEGFIVGPDDTLDRSQTYLFAWLENNIWILERPPGGQWTPVVVRGIRVDGDDHVTVQNVTETATDPWDGLMRPIGEAYKIALACHQPARDFRAYITRQTTLTAETPILYVVAVGGTPRLIQYLRFDLVQPRDRIRHSDCISAFSGGRG